MLGLLIKFRIVLLLSTTTVAVLLGAGPGHGKPRRDDPETELRHMTSRDTKVAVQKAQNLALKVVKDGGGKYELASKIVRFVQGVRYIDEKDDLAIPERWRGKSDWLQYADETMAAWTGDCEDFAILAYVMLRAVNIRAAFVSVPGHLSIAIAVPCPVGDYYEFKGEDYFFVELTDNYKIGESPVDDKNELATLYQP